MYTHIHIHVIHIHMYIHMCVHIYIYIERERDRYNSQCLAKSSPHAGPSAGARSRAFAEVAHMETSGRIGSFLHLKKLT